MTFRTFRCPSCQHDTDVEVRDKGNLTGTSLAVRFTCAGCSTVLNATTDKRPVVWPDRSPRG